MEAIRHEYPSEEAEILLPAQFAEGLDKVKAEAAGVKQSGAPAGASVGKMRVVQAGVAMLARHTAILHPQIAHVANRATYAPPADAA